MYCHNYCEDFEGTRHHNCCKLRVLAMLQNISFRASAHLQLLKFAQQTPGSCIRCSAD